MDKFPCYPRAYLNIPDSMARTSSLGNLVPACALRQWLCNILERIRVSYWIGRSLRETEASETLLELVVGLFWAISIGLAGAVFLWKSVRRNPV